MSKDKKQGQRRREDFSIPACDINESALKELIKEKQTESAPKKEDKKQN